MYAVGTEMDFKIIVSMAAEEYGAWAEKEHAPEAEFLAALKGIDGVTNVEAQLYSIMEV